MIAAFGPRAARLRRLSRRIARQRAMLAALALLAPLCTASLFARRLAPYHWAHLDLSLLEVPPTFSHSHFFGTDTIGQDVFSRTLWALGASLRFDAQIVLAATAIGVAAGLLAGWYRGWLDAALMRLADLVTAFPAILVLLAAIFYLHPISTRVLGIVLAAYLWVQPARLVRATALSLRELEFVEAARALGASDARILLRHLLPNCLGTVVVSATQLFGQAILLEATVEFFDYGVPVVTRPTLGNMIADVLKWGVGDQNAAGFYWWTWAFPAAVLVVVLVCVNLVGDGLEAALDPRR